MLSQLLAWTDDSQFRNLTYHLAHSGPGAICVRGFFTDVESICECIRVGSLYAGLGDGPALTFPYIPSVVNGTWPTNDIHSFTIVIYSGWSVIYHDAFEYSIPSHRFS